MGGGTGTGRELKEIIGTKGIITEYSGRGSSKKNLNRKELQKWLWRRVLLTTKSRKEITEGSGWIQWGRYLDRVGYFISSSNAEVSEVYQIPLKRIEIDDDLIEGRLIKISNKGRFHNFTKEQVYGEIRRKI